jgi:hypothetical protein
MSELLSLVISRNLHRRHLNESQRAMAAAAIEPRLAAARKRKESSRKAGETTMANLPQSSAREEAAALLNVSGRTVQAAKKVTENADASVQQAVVNGEVSVSDAAKIVDLPKKKQRAAVKKVQSGKAKTLAKAAAPEEDGGFEPSETYKVAKKLDTALGKCVRFKDQIKKIVGDDNAVQALHNGLDDSCKAVAVIMRKHKKAK